MTIAAADPSWWADWPKFAPGWLAFVVTVGTLVRKTWTRRHQLALGPESEELREQLTQFRGFLEDLASSGARWDWFQHKDRKGAGQKLRDSAERRTDPALRLALTRVADAWDQIVEIAPVQRGSIASPHDVRGTTDRHLARRRDAALRDARDLEQLQKMPELARTALLDAQAALDRLNELERLTHGRS